MLYGTNLMTSRNWWKKLLPYDRKPILRNTAMKNKTLVSAIIFCQPTKLGFFEEVITMFTFIKIKKKQFKSSKKVFIVLCVSCNSII